MRFLFKYATRGRPELFKSTLETWMSLLSGSQDYQFVISIDDDDWSMQTPEMKMYLENQDVDVHLGPHTTKIKAINRDVEKADDWDILIVVSDDMIPEQQGYDIVIAEDMAKYFPGLDGALHYNDGTTGPQLCTLTIMGRKLYEHFGYIYHPDYLSLWCDNEFQDAVTELGKYQYIENVIVRHCYKKHGTDETYEKSESTYWYDNETYQKRKEAGFPRESIR